jgi:mono/diheme cytochrome c family protein
MRSRSYRLEGLMPLPARAQPIGVSVAAAVMALTMAAANAQEAMGDAAAGRAFAAHACAPCHAITPGPHAERMFEIGPDFQAIADTLGMTATALTAFMQTSHPKMPNLILSREQAADVIAYILSLRSRPRPEQPHP